VSDGADHRLATYGSLAPGRVNHHELDGLSGTWRTGQVRGILVKMGWGADLGYPAIILDAAADSVDVVIFESADLPEHWPRLDAFEGDQYQRVVTLAETEDGRLPVSIYALNET
jgi:gamma-glutamylcyclotransferase (GGCT)/AIG2-like uncharacterized protein YtfP